MLFNYYFFASYMMNRKELQKNNPLPNINYIREGTIIYYNEFN